jgi:hypothetical protein
MANTFGFNKARPGRVNPMSQDYGLKMVDPEEDPAAFNLGRAVTLDVGGSTEGGIYRGVTREGAIVLFPYVEKVFLDSIVNNKAPVGSRYEWKNERPLILRIQSYIMRAADVAEINRVLGINQDRDYQI